MIARPRRFQSIATTGPRPFKAAQVAPSNEASNTKGTKQEPHQTVQEAEKRAEREHSNAVSRITEAAFVESRILYVMKFGTHA